MNKDVIVQQWLTFVLIRSDKSAWYPVASIKSIDLELKQKPNV